jgi:hypothetical protein
MRTSILLAILLVFAVVSSASTITPDASDAPKSSRIKASLQTAQKAIDAAEKAYRQSCLAAKRQLLIAIDAGITEAAKTADTTEITKLSTLKQQLEIEISLLDDGPNRHITFRVEANKAWQKVGLVRKGQKLHFSATGRWSSAGPDKMTGPDGFPLIGRVAGGEHFVIGKEYLLTVEKDGLLELRGNDSDGSLGDNVGFVTVEITLK